MKKLRGLLSIALCIAVAFVFTGCGNPYSGVNFDDYIKVAKYKGVTVEKISVSVTAKEVQAEIDKRLEAKKTTENSKTGVVKDGDTVNIDYVGSINGTKFEGGSEKGKDLKIGSGTFIPGFESGLVGAKVGTTKNIKVTFPKNYSQAKLAGKNAVFAVKINSKQIDTIPKLDEKFVKDNSDVKTVAEYKEQVKKDLEKQKKEQAEATQRTKVWNQIVTDSTMKKDKDKKDKYPQEQLDRVEKEQTTYYEDVAKKNNMSLADFAKQNFGMDEKTFKQQVSQLAKIMVKEELIVYYIADKEGIDVSGDEYDEYIKNTLAQYGYTEESFEQANNGKSYEDVEGKDRVEAAALKDKVQKWIVEHGKVATPKKETTKKK